MEMAHSDWIDFRQFNKETINKDAGGFGSKQIVQIPEASNNGKCFSSPHGQEEGTAKFE